MGCIQRHVTLKFWEMSANISEMVQDRDIQWQTNGNHTCPVEWYQYQ